MAPVMTDGPIDFFVAGIPGTGKSTDVYSQPGVLPLIFGSREQTTLKNFRDRKDILEPIVWDWYECLSDEEREKLGDEKTSALDIQLLEKHGKCRNVIRFKKFLYRLKRELRDGKRPELKSLALDNFTPFADEFKSYIEITYKADVYTREGNFDGRKFYPKYASELSDFVEFLVSLPVNVGVTCHVQYSLDEEDSKKAMDKGAEKLPREWFPNVDGKFRFELGGKFSYCFFKFVRENPGRDTDFFAKAIADQKNVGLAKARFQPFDRPWEIKVVKNKFYDQLVEAIGKGGGSK